MARFANFDLPLPVTWFLVLCLLPLSLPGQIKDIGLPNIRNYTKTEYDSGTQNWDIDQDANGNMYFANNNGLLQFDGTTWHTYKVPNSKNIRSVKVDSRSGRIYVGAYNEFGYFQANAHGFLEYRSLMSKIRDSERNSDFIWKIHLHGDQVVFQDR